MFLAQIADTFQIVGDAERRDDLAKVDGHRLAARDCQDRLLLDFALQGVDARVRIDDGRASSRGWSARRGVGDLLLGETAHLG